MSFAEDGSASTSSGEHGHGSGTDAKDQAASDNQQRAQSPQDPEQDSASVGDNTAERRKQPSTPTETDGSTDGRRSVSDLQDSMLPASTRALFARAADIMRKTNDMSGVMFLDASYAAAGSQEERPTSAGKRCQILGFATEDQSSLKGDLLPTEMTPCESNFKWVLEHYPTGYSLKCDGTDDSVPSDISSPNEENADPVENLQPNERLQTVSIDRDQHTARVKTLIPNIKSALFLPLWDFDRGRWFAACFCWSTKTERALDGRLDLPFLKAFGHSIMQGKTISVRIFSSETYTDCIYLYEQKWHGWMQWLLANQRLRFCLPCPTSCARHSMASSARSTSCEILAWIASRYP
jgi:hypothetical protein